MPYPVMLTSSGASCCSCCRPCCICIIALIALGFDMAACICGDCICDTHGEVSKTTISHMYAPKPKLCHVSGNYPFIFFVTMRQYCVVFCFFFKKHILCQYSMQLCLTSIKSEAITGMSRQGHSFRFKTINKIGQNINQYRCSSQSL